ncbi:MAG: C10 family peptidase [Bacteroidia bacterium]|nr:C10 family peptidase [Bacteroidia bacterium]
MIRSLALILWLFPWALFAQTIPATNAIEIARSVMGEPQLSLKTRYVQDSVIPVGNPDLPAAFVVTYKPTGFVIVSAHETSSLVLGYSLTSAFPANPDHPLRSWFLPAYEASASRGMPKKQGQNSQFFTDHLVLPLTSALWGQGAPWNRYCPSDSTGKRALVGCVAVAMAQIMDKWQWPPKGTGEVTYTPLQHSEYGEITVNFDTTHYRWDLTHDILPTEASALILYHAGVASYMNYDPVLSSTSVDRFAVPALINHFSFNPGMIFRDLEESTITDWIRMLRQELDNSRPVLYAGTSPDGKLSHAFNIDGYRNESYFHFNWGWNGAGDGWYTLSGMAGGGADYSSQQGAIFGLQPATMPLHDRPSALNVLSGDGFVQLFWAQPVITDFSHFIIYRNGTLIGQTADSKFRDEGKENGHSYSYQITASYQGQSPGESSATPVLTALPWTRLQPGYSQNFESGPEGWQILDSISGFQVGPAASLQFGGNPGKIAAIRSEGHPAGEQVADYLISPVIYPGDLSHPAISFDYVFRQNPGIDKLSLIWRDFNTGQWQTIANLDSTGGYSSWKNLHFYLPLSSGNTPIQIAFYYNDSFGQGYGAAIDNFMVYEVAEPAVPNFYIDIKDLCLAQTVTFIDQSIGMVQTWEWDFGDGAEPRLATTRGPHLVSYTKAGNKTVKLSLNHLDHLISPDALSIREKPVAGFEFTRKYMDISFTDKSNHAEHLLWVFGDGTTSTALNPIHTYYTKSLFEVQQIAANGTCTPDTLNVLIDMRNGTGIDDEELLSNFKIYPNPTEGKVILLWNTFPTEPMKIRLLSITGQVFLQREYPSQKELTLDLSDFPDGLYILQIDTGKLILKKQIIKIAK